MSLDARLHLRQHSLSVSGKDDAGTLCRPVDRGHPLTICLPKADCIDSINTRAFGLEQVWLDLVTMGISHDVSAALMWEWDNRLLSHSLR